MTAALQTLLTAKVGGKDSVSTVVSLNHNGTRIMSVELYEPIPSHENGYFTVCWPTWLSNEQGRVVLAESYARVKMQFQYPTWAENAFESYKKQCGVDAECMMAVGGTMQALDGACWPYKNEFGIEPRKNIEEVMEAIIESKEIPENFQFIDLESPYCKYSFGNFPGFERETGLISEFNLSSEIVEFFMATKCYKVPKEHSALLADKLSDLLWRFPKLEQVNSAK